jgi:hypothetical protein
MSVWPNTAVPGASLSGSEGSLASVSIEVEPRHLELLLEALAGLSFPVNPEIYHDAAMVYLFPDGREEAKSITLIEFPAYENQLTEVRSALEAHGFAGASATVTGMLDSIHSERVLEPAEPGARYAARYRVRRRVLAVAT